MLVGFSPARDAAMTKYKQLTYEQRCQIEALNKSGFSQVAIARTIGVSQPTISRELTRNTGLRGYRHKQAQRATNKRRKAAAKAYKMSPEMIDVVEDKLREKWSPEQISGWLLIEHSILLSHERIYLHVWADKRAGGQLFEHLRRVGKAYDKRRNGKSSRGQIKNRVSIDDRPDIVDQKLRVGDWEIDTMIGKGHSGVLVTIVERLTLFTVTARVENKSAEAVTKATIKLLTPYKDLVHTITADNGKEFAFHEQIAEQLDAHVYFAHPYSSWERGLNENTNGLLRQYWPKNTNFKTVSHDEVGEAVNQLNRRPRKTLGFAIPARLMENELAAIAA